MNASVAGVFDRELVRTFVEKSQGERLGEDVRLLYSVSGGMPSQHIEYKIEANVSGMEVEAFDARLCPSGIRTRIPADAFDVKSLFQQVSTGLHTLTPASQATPAPDALVGTITIGVEDSEESFHFIPEVEQRAAERSSIAPSMEAALRFLWATVHQTMSAETSRT